MVVLANYQPGDRRYGWAPNGRRPTQIQSLKRSKRWSILPAFTIHGYLTYQIYQGSFTAEMFNNFIRLNVLPHCGRYGEPLSVIAVDNASIHWNQALVEMLEEAEVELARLPPYSPDLNPIETSFAILKAWIRRYQALAMEYEGNGQYGYFLQVAMEAQGEQVEPGNLFRKSGIMYNR